MFTAKPSQPVNLPEFQTKSYIKGKETNKTNKKYRMWGTVISKDRTQSSRTNADPSSAVLVQTVYCLHN